MASNNALQQLLDILDGSYSSEENAIKLVALKRDCERLIAQEILKTGKDISCFVPFFKAAVPTQPGIALHELLPSEVSSCIFNFIISN